MVNAALEKREIRPPLLHKTRQTFSAILDSVLCTEQIRRPWSVSHSPSGVAMVQLSKKNQIHKYVIGELPDGTAFLGIMPFSECQLHKEVMRASMQRLGVRIRCRGGGWLTISGMDVALYGTSERYGKADHEKAAVLIPSLVPELAGARFMVEGLGPRPPATN